MVFRKSRRKKNRKSRSWQHERLLMGKNHKTIKMTRPNQVVVLNQKKVAKNLKIHQNKIIEIRRKVEIQGEKKSLIRKVETVLGMVVVQ